MQRFRLTAMNWCLVKFMVRRYIIHILKVEILLRLLSLIVFPIAFIFRKQARKHKGFLWWFLNDDCSDYGDIWFNPEGKETTWYAYRWAMRNPTQNYTNYVTKIVGKPINHRGWHTSHKPNESGIMWKTLKTEDENGMFADKNGKYISSFASRLGVQNITFDINGKKYFRYSRCKPLHLWGNLYFVVELKMGFETNNYAWQSHFVFKKYNGKFAYVKYQL
jgi:hypothetical protein